MAKNGSRSTSFKDLAIAFGGGLVSAMALQWLLLSSTRGKLSIDFGDNVLESGDDNLSRGYLGLVQGTTYTQGVSGTQGYDQPTQNDGRSYNPATASFLDSGRDADSERPRYFGSIFDDLKKPYSKFYDPGNPALFLQHSRNVNNW